MRLLQALKLRNRDEVTLKKTGEVCFVLGEPQLLDINGRKCLDIPIQSKERGFVYVLHTEVQ